MTSLQIISDPICPWCYIGKTRLERALAARPGHPFSIAWLPFQLNPNMPPGGMERRAYLERKFGGKKGAVQVYADIVKVAEAEGLALNLEKISRTPNTINAHRLIHWAGLEGVQSAAAGALFDAYFLEGLDISAPDVLADIAERVGMERALVARLLASDADRKETLAADEKARNMGVRGVPTFIIDGQYVVTGARETSFWLELIDEINAIKAAQP